MIEHCAYLLIVFFFVSTYALPPAINPIVPTVGYQNGMGQYPYDCFPLMPGSSPYPIYGPQPLPPQPYTNNLSGYNSGRPNGPIGIGNQLGNGRPYPPGLLRPTPNGPTYPGERPLEGYGINEGRKVPPSYGFFDGYGRYGISNYEGPYGGMNTYNQPAISYPSLGASNGANAGCYDRSTKCALLASTGQCANDISTKTLCPISCGVGCFEASARPLMNFNEDNYGLLSATNPTYYPAPESWYLRNYVKNPSYLTLLNDGKGSNDFSEQSYLPLSCRDSHIQGCPNWALLGYCTSEPQFMLTYCRASCGACGNLNSITGNNLFNNIGINGLSGINGVEIINPSDLTSTGINNFNGNAFNNFGVNDLNNFGFNSFNNLGLDELNNPLIKDYRRFNSFNGNPFSFLNSFDQKNASILRLQDLMSNSDGIDSITKTTDNHIKDPFNSPINPLFDFTRQTIPTFSFSRFLDMENSKLDNIDELLPTTQQNQQHGIPSSLLMKSVAEKRNIKSSTLLRDKLNDSLTKNTILRMDELRA